MKPNEPVDTIGVLLYDQNTMPLPGKTFFFWSPEYKEWLIDTGKEDMVMRCSVWFYAPRPTKPKWESPSQYTVIQEAKDAWL